MLICVLLQVNKWLCSWVVQIQTHQLLQYRQILALRGGRFPSFSGFYLVIAVFGLAEPALLNFLVILLHVGFPPLELIIHGLHSQESLILVEVSLVIVAVHFLSLAVLYHSVFGVFNKNVFAFEFGSEDTWQGPYEVIISELVYLFFVGLPLPADILLAIESPQIRKYFRHLIEQLVVSARWLLLSHYSYDERCESPVVFMELEPQTIVLLFE